MQGFTTDRVMLGIMVGIGLALLGSYIDSALQSLGVARAA